MHYTNTRASNMSRFTKIFRYLYSPKALFVTNTVTGAVFLTSGDFIEQKIHKIIDNRKEYDPKRTVVMFTAGTYFGAIGHLWYQFLDRRFVGYSRGTIVKKLVCEMIVGPPFGATVFFIVGYGEGKGFDKIWDDLKQNIVYLCIADWGFYIPLQAVNFYYLPPKYRFLYVATISLVYDTFLAYILHRNDSK